MSMNATKQGEILRKLSTDISNLRCGYPLYGRTARTPGGTPYVTVLQGRVPKEIGPEVEDYMTLEDAVEATMVIARNLRDSIPGDAMLVWRVEPEINHQGLLYTRFCFEPLSRAQEGETAMTPRKLEDRVTAWMTVMGSSSKTDPRLLAMARTEVQKGLIILARALEP